MDLGADGLQTFRHVTLSAVATALVAGGLLAFALSFDEIIVTNFTSGSEPTLPKWIFNAIRLPRNRPEANAVAAIVMVLSFDPGLPCPASRRRRRCHGQARPRCRTTGWLAAR